LVYQWVEGNQAERYENQKLDKCSLLKDAMDIFAEQYWEETNDRNSPPQQIISNHEWSVWINNRKITGDTLNMVSKHIQETVSEWLAADRNHGRDPRLSLHRQQLINTTAIADAWKDIMHEQRNLLTKTSQRCAPVGKNMHRWGFWTNSRCPCYHQDNEEDEHIFKCTHQKCRDIRSEATRVLWQ
jgi:hypothetical protein